jgi:peroxiredoxin
LCDVLETFELWEEAVALAGTMYLEPTGDANEQVKRLRILGLAHHHLGHWRQFDECRQQISSHQPASDEKRAAESKRRRRKVDSADKDAVNNASHELEGLSLLARGDTEGASDAFAKCEDLPARRKAQYAFRCGNHRQAEKLINDAVSDGKNEVPPLAVQVDLLRRMGRDDEADRAFQALRQVACQADLDAPIFKRLARLAEKFDLPLDWRLSPLPADDVGDRPALDSLGPLRWGPAAAPPWLLQDAQGHSVALSDYSGRPFVLIFYLGHGCVHCVQQLQAFAPRNMELAEAGMDLVAISSETVEVLARSAESLGDSSVKSLFEMRLLADPKLEVFKSYRCYDDFEQTPLHATFLLDAAGMIRWQDIGYEPFEDVDFLLAEAKRLLSLGGAPDG